MGLSSPCRQNVSVERACMSGSGRSHSEAIFGLQGHLRIKVQCSSSRYMSNHINPNGGREEMGTNVSNSESYSPFISGSPKAEYYLCILGRLRAIKKCGFPVACTAGSIPTLVFQFRMYALFIDFHCLLMKDNYSGQYKAKRGWSS